MYKALFISMALRERKHGPVTRFGFLHEPIEVETPFMYYWHEPNLDFALDIYINTHQINRFGDSKVVHKIGRKTGDKISIEIRYEFGKMRYTRMNMEMKHGHG